MDRRAWWSTVREVAESWTRLSEHTHAVRCKRVFVPLDSHVEGGFSGGVGNEIQVNNGSQGSVTGRQGYFYLQSSHPPRQLPTMHH